MGIIDRELYKDIEKILYNYYTLKKYYEEKEEDIIFENSNSGIRGAKGGHSDPTGNKVVSLSNLDNINNWIKVIESVKNKFEGTEKGKLLEMKYFKNLKASYIQESLYIERRTYFMWRNDIVLYTALVAQKYGDIILTKDYYNPEVLELEIYDYYRE